jgi:hypothetical protein
VYASFEIEMERAGKLEMRNPKSGSGDLIQHAVELRFTSMGNEGGFGKAYKLVCNIKVWTNSIDDRNEIHF